MGVVRHATDERSLSEAVERDELVLRYQPVVSLADWSMLGVEALVRWRPAGGPVPPDDFISLAEDTGLIVPIGRWVLEHACAQLAAWQTSAGHAHLTMAVNVSVVQLRRANFAQEVLDAITRSGICPANLTLEITESVLMSGTGLCRDRLGSLRGVGVKLAVDDFGSGFASLDYLRRFEFDEVKIDRSFSADVPTRDAETRMARAVSAFLHLLGYSTTVEGIEHEDQAAFFADLGCARGQGYAFSPPVGADAIAALLTLDALPPLTYGVPHDVG